MERQAGLSRIDFKIIKKFGTVCLALFWWLAPALLSHAQIPSQAPAATLSAGPRHKVGVSDPALAGQLAAQGARRIADYGGFQLFDVDQATATALAGKVEMRDEYNVIKLNAVPLDTSLPQIQSLRKPAGAFAGKRMHLIQFAGPVQPAWREALLQAGAQIVSYIPQNAYLVYGDAGAIGRVQALAAQAPHIQWEGSYLDDYKIHPAARPVDAKGNPRPIGTEWFAIQMMADAEANAKTMQLLDGLKLEPFQRRYAALHYLNVAGRFGAADLARIAAQPDVVSILPYFKPKKLDERQDQIVAGNLSGNAPDGPGYLAWLESKGFTQAQFEASGFAVDISDSGIDDGTTTPNHFGLYANGQISSANSRVIYNRLEGTPNAPSTLKGCDGHGTLNAHIVGGFDNSSGFPFEDSSGYHYGLGVCPFVRLGSSVIFDPDNFTSPDYPTLQSAAHRSGARISNNSWGGADGVYDADAQTYDALARDADAATAGNQEMVIVFAAGNDGENGGHTITSPATAKNVISVGAAQGVQALGGVDICGWSDAYSADANEVFSYSSRGPCDDGRHKPDIMAPGSRISGGVAQAKDPGPFGTADACFLADGSGICGGAGTNHVNGGINLFFPDGQQFYTTSTGTSHSTPAVSGGCALLRQYFINRGWTPPSAAMTKAYLMNSARYMTGPGADDTLYSDNQGMGEMNLGMAFDGAPRLLQDELAGGIFTASGQTRTFSGAVADPNKPFRVTLAWTDAPGSTIGSAANNDLDLTVTIGGVTYKGNVFSGAFSTSGGSADTLDNVESVFLPAGHAGGFTITVTAANINSIGVPNSANALEQDFALVAYNANSIGIASATLAAESCLPTNGVIDPDETVTVNFALLNSGLVNTTNLTASLLPTGGVFSPDGPKTYGVLTAGGPAVAMPFTFTANGTCGGTLTASLALQDGAASLGTASYTFQLGQFTQTTTLSENFDGVAAPALPAGWTTSATGGQGVWSTETSVFDTPPNAAFCADSPNIGVGELASPLIAIQSSTARLIFRNNFHLEAESDGSAAFDGGVLEIKIGSGAFQDILAAGGSFVSGGYNMVISSNEGANNNPLAGRKAWSGFSGPYSTNSFITTIVQLPAAAAGQTIQLKWRLGTDLDNGADPSAVGWWIDTLNVLDGAYTCCTGPALTQPEILSPASGFQTISTSIQVGGAGIPGLPLTIYDNGVPGNSLVVGANGFFLLNAALSYGTNLLSAVQSQNGTNIPGASVAVVLTPLPPTLSVPVNSAPSVNFKEHGVSNAVVSLYDNPSSGAVLLATFTNNAGGSNSGVVALANGVHSLTATQTTNGVTSLASSSAAVNVLTITPPVILSPVSGYVSSLPLISVSGTGIPGAPLAIYDGAGVVTNTVVKQNGNFTNTIRLLPGAQSLTAVQIQSNVASAPGAPVAVSWIVPPPVILAPASGLVTTNPSLTVSGTAMAAAKVTLYDGIVSNSSVIATSAGKFSAALKLGNGIHNLSAAQTANGLASLPGGTVLVTMTLKPFIVLEPRAQSMFLKGSVSFAAGASGAAPLRYFWRKNGATVAGAAAQTLMISSVAAASAGTYEMVATNTYGSAATTPVALTLIPNPFTNLVGNYYGLFSENPAQFRSSGLFTLALTSPGLGAYTGKIQNAGGSYSFTGAFSPTGQSAPNVLRTGKTPLALALSLDVSNGTQQILGTVTDGNWVAALEADLAIYATTNPSPLRGTNTIIFDSGSDGAASPGGAGWGKVVVSPAGMASLTGTLPDNTAVAPSAAGVSKYGEWPLYLPLYGAGTYGSLSGWVVFTNLPGESLEGNAAWFRTNSSGKLYPHGFTNNVSMTGSTFTPGRAKTNVLGLTNFLVTLSGGNLLVPLTNDAMLSPGGKFVTNGSGISKLTLSVVTNTGIISGSFLDPATGLATPISGVVLQEQTNAAGFFLSTNATGLFELVLP
jgi:hypothetical protein